MAVVIKQIILDEIEYHKEQNRLLNLKIEFHREFIEHLEYDNFEE